MKDSYQKSAHHTLAPLVQGLFFLSLSSFCPLIRVPVKLSYPKASDALGVQPAGYEFFKWENTRSTKLNINGEELEAHIVGEGGKVGGLVITGVVRDLINALDAGFYASTWQGKKSAMTVDNLNLWIPEYNKDGTLKVDNKGKPVRTEFSNYEPLKAAAAQAASDMIGGWMGGLAYIAVYAGFPLLISNGIPRDGSMLYLTRFMDPANITFTGVIENGVTEGTTEFIVMDENPIYKEVGADAVDKLLREKFDFIDPTSNTLYIPTFIGMRDIVNGVSSDEAKTTAKAIYGKLDATIGSKTVTVSGYKLKLAPIFKAVFSSEADMSKMIGDMQVSVKIVTYPYDSNSPQNPIIFWGLDAYGPKQSAPTSMN